MIGNVTTHQVKRTNLLTAWGPYMHALLSAIMVLKPVSGKFYRGIAAKAEDLHESYCKGKYSHWTAWSSMSRDIRRSFDFGRLESIGQFGHPGHVALFCVECCSVYDFSKLSQFPEEEELILQPNTDLKVVQCMEKSAAFEVLPSPSSLS